MAGSNLSKVTCKYHPEAEIFDDSRAGDMVCTECGLVVGDRIIDVTSEWRSFSNKDEGSKDRSRVGAAENPTMDSNLTTFIGGATGSASFSEDGQLKYRARQQVASSERNMVHAIRELESLAHRLAVVQSVVEAAVDLYRRVQETGKFKGRAHEPIITACMYIACRNEGVARTFKEIVAAANVTQKEVVAMFRDIVKELKETMQVVTSAELVNRFCGRLGVDQKCVRVAMYICNKCTEGNLLAGKNYTTIAATAIYMAANALGVRKSAAEISEAAGCAESTIKLTYKSLLLHAKNVFPADVKWEDVKANLPK